MAYNIMTPIAEGDDYADVKDDLVVLAETFLGSGQASGGNAPSTWADMRTKLNLILTAFGKTNISNSELGSSVRSKINGIINVEALLSSTAHAWWNADRADLITLVGTQISSWKDAMAGLDMVQTIAGSRPTYSATSFNGAAAATLDGVDDILIITPQPVILPVGSAPCDIFGVVSQDALPGDTSNRMLFQYGGTSGLERRAVQRSVVSASNRASVVAGTGATIPQNNNVSVDFSGRHVIRGQISSTGSSIAVDLSGLNSEVAGVPSTGSLGARIGGTLATTSFWQGQVRDIMVASVDTTQGAYLMNFFNTRRRP